MYRKYPVPGDIYNSHLYPGHQCKVIRVVEAQVTLQWIGQYSKIDPPTVPVNQFIRDFTLKSKVDWE